MLSTFLKIIITILVLIIALLVYLMINRGSQTNKNEIDVLLDNIEKVLGFKTTNTSEAFTDNVVFNTIDDITQNMNKYLKYAAPSIDMNEINSSLVKYGLNKTAETILDEHKTLDTFKFISKFNIYFLFFFNMYTSFKYTDDEEIKKYMRLNLIIQFDYMNKMLQKQLNTDSEIKQRYNNITFAEIIFNKEFLTDDIITIYMRTSNNKNIPFTDAVLNQYLLDEQSPCFSSNVLCKSSASISEYINITKPGVIQNLEDIKTYCRLMIVKYLFDLNNVDNNGNTIASPITIPSTLLDEIQTVRAKLGAAGVEIPV